MTAGWLGRERVTLAEVGSTNDEAARRARAGAPHGLVVLADAQTHGRGRLGRQWFSPVGDNLYLSCLLRLDRPPAAVPPLTLAAGVALADALRALGAPAALKWPNDVVVGGRKIAGILTEMSTRAERVEFVILGVGLNVNTLTFPPELAEIATSLRRETGGASLDRHAVCAVVLRELERAIDRFLAEGTAATMAAWRARSVGLGARVTVAVEGRRVVGRALDVDDEGALLLETEDGATLRVISGEVTLGDPST